MTRRRGIYWKRCIAILAIAGLYCQILATALAIPAAFAAMKPGDLPAGYATFIICTGDGMKRITVDADGTPVEETEQELPGDQCLACQVVGGAALLPIPVSIATSCQRPHALLPLLGTQTHIRNPGSAHALKRAPPLEL
ncbi:MAG: hypothetical protein MPJ78_18080 [Hyphomicrobiaceae bacterium]|nr:hypothetical protein [Hyphomicrobiaceae bacterium]